MKIIRAYQYVFYKFYRFERLLFDPAPEYTALFCILVLEGLNIGFLIGLAESLTGIRLLPHLSKLQILYVLVGIGLPQYFILVNRGRFKRIAAQFYGESPRRRVIGALGGWCVHSAFVCARDMDFQFHSKNRLTNRSSLSFLVRRFSSEGNGYLRNARKTSSQSLQLVSLS